MKYRQRLVEFVVPAASFLHISDGIVWAWGTNDVGQLGNGTTVSYSTTPVKVSNLLGVKAIACGSYHTLASVK